MKVSSCKPHLRLTCIRHDRDMTFARRFLLPGVLIAVPAAIALGSLTLIQIPGPPAIPAAPLEAPAPPPVVAPAPKPTTSAPTPAPAPAPAPVAPDDGSAPAWTADDDGDDWGDDDFGDDGGDDD